MQIRFRASDFGQEAKTNIVRARRNRLLVRNRMRRWCSGHLFACSYDPAVKYLDSGNSSQRRLQLLCLAPHRDGPSALRSAPDSSVRGCADCL